MRFVLVCEGEVAKLHANVDGAFAAVQRSRLKRTRSADYDDEMVRTFNADSADECVKQAALCYTQGVDETLGADGDRRVRGLFAGDGDVLCIEDARGELVFY